MWIFLNDAFLSIVQPRPSDVPKALAGRDVLLVRARKRGDLERAFGKVRVSHTPARDYRFRAFVSRERVAKVLTRRLLAIDYTNFKGSVAHDARHDAYQRVWGVMHDFQQDYAGPRERPLFDPWNERLPEEDRYTPPVLHGAYNDSGGLDDFNPATDTWPPLRR